MYDIYKYIYRHIYIKKTYNKHYKKKQQITINNWETTKKYGKAKK